MFATCSIVTLDLAEARASVHLAGHHRPLLSWGARVEPVPAQPGIALGVAPGTCDWAATELTLPPSGALLLYTDGLVEGFAGPGRARFGEEALIDLISSVPDLGAEPLLDHLIRVTRRLNAGRHADDVAILHLAWGDRRDDAGGR